MVTGTKVPDMLIALLCCDCRRYSQQMISDKTKHKVVKFKDDAIEEIKGFCRLQ